jgi:HEPN domain-containing protein
MATSRRSSLQPELAMNKFAQRLMRESAIVRLRDAEALRGLAMEELSSDSESLLSLLAFELLLKCALAMHGIAPSKNGHRYKELFNQLPENVRAEVLERARTRIGPGSELDSAPDKVLSILSNNFIRLRYPHEDYEHVTEAEYKEMGEEWAAIGYPSSVAMQALYPNELFGLTEALLGVTEQLVSQASQKHVE